MTSYFGERVVGLAILICVDPSASALIYRRFLSAARVNSPCVRGHALRGISRPTRQARANSLCRMGIIAGALIASRSASGKRVSAVRCAEVKRIGGTPMSTSLPGKSHRSSGDTRGGGR